MVGDRVVHGVGGRRGGLTGPFYVHSFTAEMVRIARKRGGETHDRIVSPYCLAKVFDQKMGVQASA